MKRFFRKLFGTAQETLEHASLDVIEVANPIRKSALRRFPILFTLLSTFGLVSTLYGFESIINEIALLHNNPLIMLCFGIGVLALTGTLYKKL